MPKLTPEIAARIVGLIRAGSYPHVAAESAGVPREEFSAWLQQGKTHQRGRYRELWMSVLEAKAQARARAEIDAREKDAKFWLRCGPARWTAKSQAKPFPKGTWQPSAQAFYTLLAELVELLAPFPDARRAILNHWDLNPENQR
jgi:hypothetical protein